MSSAVANAFDLHGRQWPERVGQSGKNGNDGNDDQQFNGCEASDLYPSGQCIEALG